MNIPKQNKKVLNVFTITTFFLTLLLILGYWLGLKINLSKSYPPGIYKTVYKNDIEKGDLVIFCPPNNLIMQQALKRKYIQFGFCDGGFYPLLKKVVALEGDIVEINSSVYINNQKIPNSEILTYDGNQNPLPVLKKSRRKLPKSHIFVMSDYYNKSFDSRYFDSVGVNTIINHVKPIYLFQN